MYRITELLRTCPACPSQWAGRTEKDQDVYIRYRWGGFRMDVDDHTVYSITLGSPLDGYLTTKAMVAHLESAGIASFDGLEPEWGWPEF